jgi:hypothetical protein
VEPSREVRALYLDPAEAGAYWLLDPGNAKVIEKLREARDRTPETSCDARAFEADLGDLVMGCTTFGNLVPYLLPRSGLVLRLPTMWFGYRDVEMVGLPVDREIDPRTPAASITNDFDRLWDTAT